MLICGITTLENVFFSQVVVAIIEVLAIPMTTVERTDLGDSPITVVGAGLPEVEEQWEESLEEEGTTGLRMELEGVVAEGVWHTHPPVVPREALDQGRLVMATGGVLLHLKPKRHQLLPSGALTGTLHQVQLVRTVCIVCVLYVFTVYTVSKHNN